jgi:hypothetical protein
VSCEHCGTETEPGQLLVSAIVYWSETRDVGFLGGRRVLNVMQGRGTYAGRPHAFRADLCRSCASCTVVAAPCAHHAMNDGWIFPHSSLLWVSGEESWTPSFWWPFSRKGTNGRLAEVLVSPGLPLTISRARQRARRCNQCGVIEILYGVAD